MVALRSNAKNIVVHFLLVITHLIVLHELIKILHVSENAELEDESKHKYQTKQISLKIIYLERRSWENINSKF